MPERSRHQEKIIRNYYQNRDTIALQRSQEIVSEIYLSEGKKRQRYWQNLKTHLLKLGIAEKVIDHWIEQDRPELVADELKKFVSSG